MPIVTGIITKTITLKARLSENRKELRVDFRPAFRLAPGQVFLHIPPVQSLRTVTLNGKRLKWDRRQTSIQIQSAALINIGTFTR